jgi:mannose-6-phosphate isomerase-like protein (cupin superfamily)
MVELSELVPSFVVSKMADAQWSVGRAGMLYRDLIPDRQGGRFIASQIRIPEGGEVGDWVHHHDVAFQIIFCHRGWVRVAYEDQGPPVTMEAGDCLVQPPTIRHRVLECSPELSVVEVASPARHETRADEEMELPTRSYRPERTFRGQRFTLHREEGARWSEARMAGFAQRDSGIGEASGGAGNVRVARIDAPGIRPKTYSHDADLVLWFVLDGAMTLHVEGRGATPLAAGDAVVVPRRTMHALSDCADDLALLEVSVPARFETKLHSDVELVR